MSRDFVKNVNEKLLPLENLLGKENVEEIKTAIKNMIIQAVENDISYYRRSEYLFYPPDYIKGIAEEAFDEVEKKIKKMYKDAMLDVAERSVEKYKDFLEKEGTYNENT